MLPKWHKEANNCYPGLHCPFPAQIQRALSTWQLLTAMSSSTDCSLIWSAKNKQSSPICRGLVCPALGCCLMAGTEVLHASVAHSPLWLKILSPVSFSLRLLSGEGRKRGVEWALWRRLHLRFCLVFLLLDRLCSVSCLHLSCVLLCILRNSLLL